MVAWRNKQEKQCGPPPVINCFISPINYSCTINHTYWSYKPSKLSRGPTLKGKKVVLPVENPWKSGSMMTAALRDSHPLAGNVAVKTRAPDELPLPSPTNDTQIYREMSIGLEAPEVVPVHPLRKPWGTCMSIHLVYLGPLWKDLFKSFKSFKSSLYLVLQKTMTKQPVLQPVGSSSSSQVWYIWCSYDSIRYTSYIIHPWNTICQSC